MKDNLRYQFLCANYRYEHTSADWSRRIYSFPGVLGNKGTGAFFFRDQGIFSNYFQGTRELLNRLLGTREHQSNLKGFFYLSEPLKHLECRA